MAISLTHLLLNQLLYLKRLGLRVTAISSRGSETKNLIDAGIPHIEVSISRRITPCSDLQSIVALILAFRAHKFTIVHTHTPKPGLLGQIAAKIGGVPVIVNTVHGFYFHENMNPILYAFFFFLEWIAAFFSDVIFFQSKEDCETARRLRICAPSKIVHIGNGIDLLKFNPDVYSFAARQAQRDTLTIPHKVPVIGFVGRLVEEKGIVDLIDAASRVWERFPTAVFLLVGPQDVEKRDALRPDVLEKMKRDERFRIVGMRSDMPEMYSIMDIFVLPSYREGFPRSAMEASAMGVPSVVSDIRGCREVVRNGYNGLLVPHKNPERLADAIIYLLTSRDIAERFSRRGRKIALECFDERNVFTKVSDTYSLLLKKKKIVFAGNANDAV